MKRIIYKIFILVLSIALVLEYPLAAMASEAESEIFALESTLRNQVQPRSGVYTTVKTPMGSSVEVFIDDYILSEGAVSVYDAEADAAYPDAIRLQSATTRYNCHSYAWYSQNHDTNIYWMEDPSRYLLDGSADEIEKQVGCIVVYFSPQGQIVHSGIVTELLAPSSNNGVCGDVSTVMVTSKWGEYGTYSHRGDMCPYTAYAEGKEPAGSVLASYVRYYHLHTPVYVPAGTLGHEHSCSTCGTIFSTGIHVVQQTVGGKYKCIYCGYLRPDIPGFNKIPHQLYIN